MKTTILTQAQKQHHVNRLHDAFIAAGVIPERVESNGTSSTFMFQDSVADASIQTVITNYVYVAPTPPANIKQLAQNYKNAVNAATNVAQLKSALTVELVALLKEMAKRETADLFNS